MQDVLYIVVPCYNEENVLPLTAGTFLQEIKDLTEKGKISDRSRILFVNDGSTDRTWEVIRALAMEEERYTGLSLTRNCGTAGALLAGIREADGPDRYSFLFRFLLSHPVSKPPADLDMAALPSSTRSLPLSFSGKRRRRRSCCSAFPANLTDYQTSTRAVGSRYMPSLSVMSKASRNWSNCCTVALTRR